MAFYHNIHLPSSRVPLTGALFIIFTLLVYIFFHQASHGSASSQGLSLSDSIAGEVREMYQFIKQTQEERQRVFFEAYSPRNSTLGFERILALSKGTSWRQQGLLSAAHLSNIMISIPPQPGWSKELSNAFEGLGSDTKPNHGAALAWLAHIDVLKYIIQSKLNSALVLEDDVDWDVNIKEQMTLISYAVRNHTDAPDDDIHPYSHRWDVLWIGHCGDIPLSSENVTAFEDRTVVPFSSYKGWARDILSRISEGQRAVYNSNGAVCTFAYAVNKPGAKKVLDFVSSGQDQAFDIKLMNGCRSNAYKCIVVNPEVMRHFKPDPEFGESSEIGQVNSQGGEKIDNEDMADREEGGFGTKFFDEARRVRGTTENIKQSARCQSLWGKTCMPK
ncbi:hypothetical protein F5884DRAFT_852112 [Xylogone sp. PMI_703]|nr:hypothetical protein F5884DRAFT_852112 [Xylogone sp. PMI_703]